jgi:type VI secretion system protein ImpK
MRLTDCFIELIAYTAYFIRSVAQKQPPYEQVKADILRTLSQSDDCLKKNLFPPEEYDMARFAVCAWVDEMILNSPWQEKDHWKREQLQRLFYRTTDAGEEFFDRLNMVGYHQRDVREVYFLCLALGFMGRYCHPGDEFLLAQVKSSNLKLLMGSSVGPPSLDRAELFPEAYQIGNLEPYVQKGRRAFPLVNIVGIVGPVLLFGLLYLIYNFTLNSIMENFFSRVV